jgi:ParB-like chromosome segregation protein Spo0J
MAMTTHTDIRVHPLAEAFPLLDDAALQELADDIRQNGQQTPILACCGVIIDGRNRLRACEIAGVEPEFLIRDDLSEAEIVAAIVSANIHRRHLTTQQRAHLAAELANGTWGGDRSKGSFDPSSNSVTIKEAAAALNVSEPSVKRAAALKRADPEAHQAALRGEREVVRQAKQTVVEVREREKPKPAQATTATDPPKRRKPDPVVAPMVEAMEADPEAFRMALRTMLDFEFAADAANALRDAFSHRAGFALEVAEALHDAAPLA